MKQKMSDDNKKQVNEPLSEYGQPLNFEKVWQMFQVTNQQFQEIREQSKETERKIDKLAKLYGNVSENSRDVAEEFFKRGLESRKSILWIPYTEVGHLEKKKGKLQGEFDIVLYNGDSMIVVEVKYKLHPNDVDDFVTRKLPNFKKLFHEYADKKIVGAVAGMSVPTDSFEIAKKHGLLVLTKLGENLSVMNPDDFVPRFY